MLPTKIPTISILLDLGGRDFILLAEHVENLAA